MPHNTALYYIYAISLVNYLTYHMSPYVGFEQNNLQPID